MNDGHLTEATRRKLANGELQGAELIAALRHAGTCELCAPRGEALDRMEDEALHALLDEHAEEARVPWRTLAAAALLAGIAVLVAYLIYERRRPSPQPAPPVVTTSPQRESEPPLPDAPVRRPREEWLHLIDAAVLAGKLPFPSTLGELAPPPDSLRGTEPAHEGSLEPAGVVIRETRPLLRWPEENGATYVVAIFANDVEQARSGVLRSAQWHPTRDLARGATYMWQVEIRHDGETHTIPAPPAPPAMFRITTAKDEAAIDEALQQWPDEYLLHAVLFARAGLRDAANDALHFARAAGDERAAKIRL